MYKASNVSDTEIIHKELEFMQSFLETDYNADVQGAVQERFDYLAGYMARSGKLKADAEYHYNNVVESTIMGALKQSMEEKLATSTLNKYVEAVAKDYKFLVTWSDRVNRSCTHQYEGMRTVISSLRAEQFASRQRT